VHKIDEWADVIAEENATGKTYVRGYEPATWCMCSGGVTEAYGTSPMALALAAMTSTAVRSCT
jgi:hypothetical protein